MISLRNPIPYLLFVVCVACGNRHVSSKGATHVDSSAKQTIAVLGIKSLNLKGVFNKKLSGDDLHFIDSLLLACVVDHNSKVKLPRKSLSDSKFCLLPLKLYKRQYVPYVNVAGEKYVLVYCFYDPGDWSWHKDWHHKIAQALDGGNNYFHVKISLKKRTFSELEINPYG